MSIIMDQILKRLFIPLFQRNLLHKVYFALHKLVFKASFQEGRRIGVMKSLISSKEEKNFDLSMKKRAEFCEFAFILVSMWVFGNRMFRVWRCSILPPSCTEFIFLIFFIIFWFFENEDMLMPYQIKFIFLRTPSLSRGFHIPLQLNYVFFQNEVYI